MYQAIIEYPTPLCITEELSRISAQIENLRDYQTRLKSTSNFVALLLAKAPGNPRQSPGDLAALQRLHHPVHLRQGARLHLRGQPEVVCLSGIPV